MYYVYVHSNPLGTYDMTRLQCSSLDPKVRTTKTPDELSAVLQCCSAAVLCVRSQMSPCPSNWVREVTADTELQQQHTLSTPHLTSSGLVQHINAILAMQDPECISGRVIKNVTKL